jgi:hypothetical protein
MQFTNIYSMVYDHQNDLRFFIFYNNWMIYDHLDVVISGGFVQSIMHCQIFVEDRNIVE